MNQFIKHSDAQMVLWRLGLPMIDRMSARGLTSVEVIADDDELDDDEREHGSAVAAIADIG